MRIMLAALLALAAFPVPALEHGLIRIDPVQSQASFRVSLRIPLPAEGRFKTITGEIQQLPDLRLSVHVILDARELNMSGPPWVQKITQSAQFLDSAKHPMITYQSDPFSSQVLISGGEVTGSIDIRGVTGEVLFSIKPSACRQPGRSCPIMASGSLNRHDFGMSAYRWGLRDQVRFAFQLKFMDE